MDCKICPIDNNFWLSIENPGNEIFLIKEFYAHKVDTEFSCLNNDLKLCAISQKNAISNLVSILLKYSCAQILDIIKNDFKTYDIESKDIPQFSDFDDCYHSVIDKLVCLNIDGITYEKMGFLLRKPNTTRTPIADHKYGENHSKVAAAMGLCSFDKKHLLRPTAFGKCFQSLDSKDKLNLRSKLCLYIPLLQNIFVQGNTDDIMDKYLNILSESTQMRRRSNIKTLRTIISDSVDYGL
ncbi:MAG: hypothetical protein MJZ33_09805 [Paludibacteraceae bacterium]|nr:hypothetical protein [Paludibacteraceae bacterium]